MVELARGAKRTDSSVAVQVNSCGSVFPRLCWKEARKLLGVSPWLHGCTTKGASAATEEGSANVGHSARFASQRHRGTGDVLKPFYPHVGIWL